MKIPARATQEDLFKAVNGRLSIQDNFQAKIISVADTGAANTQFTVNHNLGKTPDVYFYNIDRNGVVYDSSRATWTNSQMTLKCSVANAVLVIVVF